MRRTGRHRNNRLKCIIRNVFNRRKSNKSGSGLKRKKKNSKNGGWRGGGKRGKIFNVTFTMYFKLYLYLTLYYKTPTGFFFFYRILSKSRSQISKWTVIRVISATKRRLQFFKWTQSVHRTPQELQSTSLIRFKHIFIFFFFVYWQPNDQYLKWLILNKFQLIYLLNWKVKAKIANAE